MKIAVFARAHRRVILEILAISCALATIVAMSFQMRLSRGLLLANGMPLFGDFMSFWSAGRIVLEGHVALVHDPHALMAAHREAVPGLTKYFPWRSPPTFLLLMTPLALLPYAPAALIFIAVGVALYIFGMRGLMRTARGLIFALSTPTALLQFGSFQIGFAMAGLWALALRWLDKRPIVAGAAIAAMAIKPHLAILWPLFLAAQGRWRVFVAAGAFTAAFVLIAGLTFGFDSYARFFADLGEAQGLVTRRGLPPNTLASLYANLLSLHVPANFAMAAHVASALAAVSLAVVIFRRRDPASSAAALAAATLLVSPYLFFYDTMILAPAVALLARDAPLTWRALSVYALAFLAGAGALWIGLIVAAPICPLAAWSVLALAAGRAKLGRRETARAETVPREHEERRPDQAEAHRV